MLHAGKTTYRLVDLAVGQPGDPPHRGGGPSVVEVVAAGYRHRRRRLMAVEPDDLGMSSVRQLLADRVIAVQDRVVVGLLVVEDAGLGVDVSLESVVAV